MGPLARDSPAPALPLRQLGPRRPSRSEGVALQPSPSLSAFAEAAATAGLGLPEAVALGLERALVLHDATAIGFDSEIARRRLSAAAAQARPTIPLGDADAARVRALGLPQPVAPPDLTAPCVVRVPPRTLARARGRVSADDLQPLAVREMVAWETAATLAGRTMGEWALLVLAGS